MSQVVFSPVNPLKTLYSQNLRRRLNLITPLLSLRFAMADVTRILSDIENGNSAAAHPDRGDYHALLAL